MTDQPLARVLVVDDEISLVNALKSTLEQHGYSVTGSCRSSDALALLKQEKFELLLADLSLPDLDGIALLRTALTLDPGMIGIIMTGHASVDTAVEAMKVGALDYVLKPFRLSAVLAVLSRARTVQHLRSENEDLQKHLQAWTTELEAANQELEAFTYSASHDLRGPIRSIAGFASAVIEGIDQGNLAHAREAAVRIHARTQRMQALTEDLLRLARAARAEVRFEDVDLADIARDVFTKLQSETPNRSVHVEIAPSLKVSGDAGLLRLAMENLLSNAWKYTGPNAEPRIEVGSELQDGSSRVYFIRDNGVGFDPKHTHKLFVPFERLHPEAQFPGTGIGLTTVQRIILKHGGRVWAEATPEKGATFRFTLPNAPSTASPTSLARSSDLNDIPPRPADPPA